jgi:hypothetical protein
VSFTGTGKIDFTTAYTGTLQGTGNLVCTVTGTVTLAQCEVGSTATPYQAIGASWAATYTSLALAAGYPISLYSDRAGTTATVGPDDQVGVLLDGSEGLSKLDQSSQLLPILSGYFDGAGPSDGQLNAPGGTYRSTQWFPVTAGGWYLLRSDGNRARWRFKTSTGTVFSFLDGYNVVVAPTTAAFAQVYFTADNVYSYLSVYSVPGYHAIAPSVAGSPTLRLDGNGRWYLDRDTTDDALAITWPANFTTTAVQYVADQATTTETTGITLNGATSYTTPQRPTGDYGRIIFKTPTTYSAKVLKYLAGKAGR